MIAEILARFPSVEVAARLAYWRIPIVMAAGDALRKRLSKRRKARAPAASGAIDFTRVSGALRDLGVRDGDILIVHSSFNSLKPTGLSPPEVIAALKSLVGEAGTLAMPAIPVIAHEPQGSDKLASASYDQLFEYDVASPRILTGALPRALMMSPDAHRSRHPGNSMVAIGPEGAAMMLRNLEQPEPIACGPGSSWEYSYRRDAAIVALGVDLVHSLTMIHVAEDAFEAQWPVRDWYRRRRFRVRDGEFEQQLTVRERKHSWAQFYAERAFSRDLHRAGIAQTVTVDGLEIHLCRSRALVDFLTGHPRAGYPYVFPLGFPRKPAVA